MSDERPTTTKIPELQIEDAETGGGAVARVVTPQPAPRQQVLQAVDQRPSVDTYSIVRHSPDIGELIGALSKAQGDFTQIERTLKAKIETRREGARGFEYEYAPLDEILQAVRPALAAHGIAIMQFPFSRSGGGQSTAVTVRTMIGHESGQWMTNDLTVSADGSDPKAIGSAITYARRYSVMPMLGVAPSYDDDGDAASSSNRPQKNEAPQPGQRRSAAEKPAPPAPTGAIKDLAERGTGMLVRLESGFVCSTLDKAMMTSLRRLAESRQRVELLTHPSSDPERYAPVLDEITVLNNAE